MASEAEVSAFQALYSDLKDVLKSGVGDLTDKAFSKGLISEEVKSQVTSRLVSLTIDKRDRGIGNDKTPRILSAFRCGLIEAYV